MEKNNLEYWYEEPYPDPCNPEIPSTTCFEGVTGVTLVDFTATSQPNYATPGMLIILMAILLNLIIIYKRITGWQKN